MKILWIVRGPSGSGKTRLAHVIGITYYEADKFFIDPDGYYKFDYRYLADAHEWCRLEVKRAMRSGASTTVSNTFTRHSEMVPYLELAKEFGYTPRVIRAGTTWDAKELADRNIHGVPLKTIKRQIARFEYWPGEIDGHQEKLML
jgi:predicted kinase